MLESVNENDLPFDECVEILKKNIKIDPSFKEFYEWCKSHEVPLVIVSSGMEPIIRAVFETTVGVSANEVDIISNSVKVNENGKFEILFRHPERFVADTSAPPRYAAHKTPNFTSGYGHDKSQAILPYRSLPHKPILIFLGDGVSDLSAAQHADILFAKDKADGENDLAAYCTKMGIKHLTFKHFGEVLPIVASVVEETATVEDVLKASPI
ncbi:hypothetical protein FRC04_001265 [Tulasnella sp. 424]|nr:hypothetical protein FRC04_001265 [Tulasnella sp. 424]